MLGRAWIGLTGIGAAAAAVTWFGIVKNQPPAPAPAPPMKLAAVPADPAPKPEAPAAPAAPQVVKQEPAPTAPASPPIVPAADGAAPEPVQQAAQAPVKPQAQTPAEPAQQPASAAAPTPSAASQPPAAIKLPTFDIVRVEPSGDTVVAGQGVPGATVELLKDGAPFARAVADVGGQWAIVPKPLPKGAAELALRATTPDGRVALSQQVVTVRVPTQQGEEVVVVLNDPNAPAKVLSDGGQKAAPARQVVAQAPPAAAPVAAPVPAAAPAAPAPSTPAAPVRVAEAVPSAPPPAVSTPAPAAPAAPAPVPAAPAAAPKPAAPVSKPAEAARINVEIKTVEADEAGRFFVTGTAQPGADVRIYLNETPLANVRAAPDGSFGLMVEKGMRPGNYRVRVDDVDNASGRVLTRAEVPFTMEARARPAAPPAVVTAQAEVAPKPAATVTRDIGTPPQPGTPVAKPAAGAEAVQTARPAVEPEQAVKAPVPSDSQAVVAEVKTVTVARGDNLWRISRKSYGRGMRYTWIYDANATQIRDPHWIYPGQIFVMPEKKDQAAQ